MGCHCGCKGCKSCRFLQEIRLHRNSKQREETILANGNYRENVRLKSPISGRLAIAEDMTIASLMLVCWPLLALDRNCGVSKSRAMTKRRGEDGNGAASRRFGSAGPDSAASLAAPTSTALAKSTSRIFTLSLRTLSRANGSSKNLIATCRRENFVPAEVGPR